MRCFAFGIVRRLTIVLIAAIASAGATGSTTAAPTWSVLHGRVSPGHIALKNGLREPFLHGRPDLYVITVVDTSPANDFHLVGPGVNTVVTSTAFVGAHTVQLALQRGTYRYRSDTHPAVMKGSFVIV